ncbi:MAG: hypothetical protein ACRCSK_04235 [Fusobacteriaceae bacterium]
MFTEKTMQRLENISEKFSELGYDFLKEDIKELFEQRDDIREKMENTKFGKIEFFKDDENNSVGFTLSDYQIEFFVETGEDEEGHWYEATAEVIYFGGEE